MQRRELKIAVESLKEETRTALQTVYDALNSGQKKKILKDDKVKSLFELYNVDTGEEN